MPYQLITKSYCFCCIAFKCLWSRFLHGKTACSKSCVFKRFHSGNCFQKFAFSGFQSQIYRFRVDGRWKLKEIIAFSFQNASRDGFSKEMLWNLNTDVPIPKILTRSCQYKTELANFLLLSSETVIIGLIKPLRNQCSFAVCCNKNFAKAQASWPKPKNWIKYWERKRVPWAICPLLETMLNEGPDV